MNRKVKFFKQCFCQNNKNVLQYQKLQHDFEWCLSALTQAHNRFATHLLPCWWYVVRSRRRNSLSGVSGRYFCYGNCTAGSQQI